MKIAITGGAGFIGSHLASAYLDAGHDVLVIDNLARGLRQNVDARARFYKLDIRDTKVQEVLQHERPDVVSHHAAQPNATFPGESLLADADVQVRGLLNILEGCVNASVKKVIYASNGLTLYQPAPITRYSHHRFHVLQEEARLAPHSPNDISKLAGERYVRYYTQHYRLEHTILRYAQIYGEAHNALARHPVTYFADMLLQGQRPIIRESAHDVRDHLYIDDVVKANLSALERGCNYTLHISSGQGYSLDQIFEAIARHFSSDLLPVYLSITHNTHNANAQTAPTALVLDNTLAQQQLCWRPQIDFPEGVRRAVEMVKGQKVPASPKEVPARERVLSAVLASV